MKATQREALVFYRSLCAAFGRSPSESQFEQWVEDLVTCEAAALEDGVRVLRRRSERFPSLATVLAVMAGIQPKRVVAGQPEEGRLWCEPCQDTGWISEDRQSALKGATWRVCYARPCGCRESNPVYQANLVRPMVRESEL